MSRNSLNGRYPIAGDGQASRNYSVTSTNASGEFFLLPIPKTSGLPKCNLTFEDHPYHPNQPDTEYILLDSGSRESGDRIINTVYKLHGKVIGVILTHFDDDHFGGFKKIYETSDDTYKKFLSNIEFIVTPSLPFQSGQYNTNMDLSKLISNLKNGNNINFGTFEQATRFTSDDIGEYVFNRSRGTVLVRKTHSTIDYKCLLETSQNYLDSIWNVKYPINPIVKCNIPYHNLITPQKNMMALWTRTVGFPKPLTFSKDPNLNMYGGAEPKVDKDKISVDRSYSNLSSLLVCYIGKNEYLQNICYSFNGDTVLSEAAYDHKWFPKNNNMYKKLMDQLKNIDEYCYYSFINSSSNNHLYESNISSKNTVFDDVYFYLFSFPFSHYNLDSFSYETCNSIRTINNIYQSGETDTWDMFQLPHHGSRRNLYPITITKHQYQDTTILKYWIDDHKYWIGDCRIELKDHLKKLARNYLVMSPGTLYHCDPIIYQAWSDGLEDCHEYGYFYIGYTPFENSRSNYNNSTELEHLDQTFQTLISNENINLRVMFTWYTWVILIPKLVQW